MFNRDLTLRRTVRPLSTMDGHAKAGARAWQMHDLDIQGAAQDAVRQAHEIAHAELEEELNAIRAQAREEGFQAGLEQGIAEGRSQGHLEVMNRCDEALDAAAQPLRDLCKTLQSAISGYEAQMAQKMATMIIKTAEFIAHQSIKESPQAVAEVVRSLIQSEPALKDSPRLWVNPEDFDLVEELTKADLDAMGWTLMSDKSITRGGCRVTSASGEVDATLETRIAQAHAAILG